MLRMMALSAVLIDCSSIAMSPCLSARSRTISENRVVLPAPLGPNRSATCPAGTANDTLDKTGRCPKVYDTSETVSMVIGGLARSVRVPAILECLCGSDGVFFCHIHH